MVSLTDLDHWSLRRTLSKAAADDATQPLHARGFAAWIQQELPVQTNLLRTLAADAISATGPRQSSNAALLGYAASLDPDYASPFADGVAWLRERQYFLPGRAPGFEVDGLALLGIAAGLRARESSPDGGARAWLTGLLDKSLQLRRPLDWNEALIAAAAETLGVYSAANRVSDDLRVALAGKGLLNTNQAARASAWTLIAGLAGSDDGNSRAAAQASALAVLVRDSSTLRTGTSSVTDVANVLTGVAKSMRRWAWESKPRTSRSAIARWVIDNEYHVQDMLWAILAPVFPDDLIQEVAADASTYLQDGSGYTSILAFVWDDAARTEEHAELRQGLLRIRGVVDAIVLPRPLKMDRSLPVAVGDQS